MDDLDLTKYGWVRSRKDFLQSGIEASLGPHFPCEPVAASELGCHGTQASLAPARAVRDHREQARADLRRRERHAQALALQAGSKVAETARYVVAYHYPANGAVDGEEIPLRPDKFVRAGGFHHRRPLPGAGPHAGAQRTDRPRVPAVGDAKPAAEGHVQIYAVERHCRDVRFSSSLKK